MTTEQKFKQLLDIACKNGYQHHKMTIDLDKDLNNLVLQTNFFECLFKNFNGVVFTNLAFELYKGFETKCKINEYVDIIQTLKFQWVLEVKNRTALEWLFKQFNK